MLRRRPQTIAWISVLAGLMSFCLLCSATGYGVYFFVFQSSVPLSVRLVVSRGVVKLKTLDNSDPLVDNQQVIEPQTALDVRDESQAVLFFQDSYSKEIITTITLTAGTQIFVTDASRPRFEFSRRPYRIDLSRAQGQLIITTRPGDRDYIMDVHSDLGMARILDDGRYTVNTEYMPETGLRRLNVFNQGGRAELFKPSLLEWREVNANRIAHIARSVDSVPDFEPETDSPYAILLEGRFLTGPEALPATALPDNWSCQSISEQPEAQGTFFRDPENENALRFQRIGDNRIKHAETSCLVSPDNAVDTSAYSTLRLHLRIMIKQHDLPQCGILGSECPIMVEIAYQIPQQGDAGPILKWHHGFYLIPDPSKPASCDTCRLAHERINPDVWYFYDSGNLRPQFADPSSGAPIIRWISVYASGHQYDSLVSDVTLLGTR